jgi:hypothetical protein
MLRMITPRNLSNIYERLLRDKMAAFQKGFSINVN